MAILNQVDSFSYCIFHSGEWIQTNNYHNWQKNKRDNLLLSLLFHIGNILLRLWVSNLKNKTNIWMICFCINICIFHIQLDNQHILQQTHSLNSLHWLILLNWQPKRIHLNITIHILIHKLQSYLNMEYMIQVNWEWILFNISDM